MKHFSFDAGKRENRNVNGRDDHNAEKHRVPHLFARGEHHVRTFRCRQLASQMMLFLGELAHDVLHDHHCAIDDQTEINRAEAHQSSRNAKPFHAHEREEKRQRNGQRHNQRGAPIAEQKQ